MFKLAGLKKFILKKTISTLITLFAVITINFIIFRVMPGNPVHMMFTDPRVSKENIDVMMKRFGLDKPLWMQYFIYVRELFIGNLGISFWKNVPVIDVILGRLPQTIILLSFAILLSTVAGVFLGAYAAWKRGSKIDASILTVSLVTYSVPSFWVGILLLITFSYWLGLFPLGGITTPGIASAPLLDQIIDYLWHMALPLITLFFYYTGGYVLIMRNAMLDVLGEDYITTAYAKGLKEAVIMRKHAMRNALLPVATITALNIGWMIAGVVEVEVVFAWPGLGKLMYDAIMQRDYPLLQGVFLFIAISVILANFLADVIYGYLDPRVREEK